MRERQFSRAIEEGPWCGELQVEAGDKAGAIARIEELRVFAASRKASELIEDLGKPPLPRDRRAELRRMRDRMYLIDLKEDPATIGRFRCLDGDFEGGATRPWRRGDVRG